MSITKIHPLTLGWQCSFHAGAGLTVGVIVDMWTELIEPCDLNMTRSTLLAVDKTSH